MTWSSSSSFPWKHHLFPHPGNAKLCGLASSHVIVSVSGFYCQVEMESHRVRQWKSDKIWILVKDR